MADKQHSLAADPTDSTLLGPNEGTGWVAGLYYRFGLQHGHDEVM